MAKKLENPFGHDEYLVYSGRHRFDPESMHYVFEFPNGYGLSVLRSSFSYGNFAGCWETALMRTDDDGKLQVVIRGDIPDFTEEGIAICGNLEEVKELLDKLKALPSPK